MRHPSAKPSLVFRLTDHCHARMLQQNAALCFMLQRESWRTANIAVRTIGPCTANIAAYCLGVSVAWSSCQLCSTFCILGSGKTA